VNQISIDYQYVERREGDLDVSYADVSLAEKELGWSAEYDLNSMVKMEY
jgi:UDP-glucose 4-epimerase